MLGTFEQQVADTLNRLGVAAQMRCVVGVSGGADSMALLTAASASLDVVAVTVDHGLRPESCEEAAQVHAFCDKRNIPHHTLIWNGEKPTANIQAAARQARYALLQDFCEKMDIDTVLLAHHRDDQAETFLLRLARGSGLTGLSAMQPKVRAGGIQYIRPLLDVPKADLVQYLTTKNICWIEDPSNENLSFDRIKVRQFLNAPPLEGFTPARMATTVQALGRAAEAIDFYRDRWLADYAKEDEFGVVSFQSDSLGVTPVEIQYRVLSYLLQAVSGADYGPRFEKLQSLYSEIYSGIEANTLSLHGCIITTSGAGQDGLVTLCREAAAVPALSVLSGDAQSVWDNRYMFRIQAAGYFTVRTLDDAAWGQARKIWPQLETYRLDIHCRRAQPVIYKDDKIYALPTFECYDGGRENVEFMKLTGILPKK